MENLSTADLIEQCISGNPKQQASAIMDLVYLKAYSAVPVLLKLLHSSDDCIRSNAAGALGRLGKQEIDSVGPALINALKDPESLVRADATASLGLLAYQPALDAVIFLLLNDSDFVVRADAAETLGEIGDINALEYLKLAMQDPEPIVRSYVANSLGLLGTPELLEQLQTYLNSEDSPKVKADLWGAQYRLGKTEALEQFLSLLANADLDLATNMFNVLGDLLDRKLPPTIVTDAPRIDQVLDLVKERISLLSGHAQKLQRKLREITQAA